jgi:CheY-like chemotaxis protein
MSKVPLVLHVDDSKMMLEVVKDIIAYDFKLSLVQAKSGEECIKLAKEHQPDIIFIDAIMAPMDGWQTARELKKIAKTKDIPIVMVTGESKVEDIELAYSIGVNDYIVKPPTKDKLLRKMVKILGENVFRELGIAIPGEACVQPAKQAEEKAPAPPPVKSQAVPQPAHCSGCGGFLTWVPGQGWYCYGCQQYPALQPPAPAVKQMCSRCGKEMAFLSDGAKWYCFDCNK